MGSGGQPKQVLLNPFNIEDQRTLMGALALHQLNEVQAVLCHDVDFIISGMDRLATLPESICCVPLEGLGIDLCMTKLVHTSKKRASVVKVQ